MIFNIGGSSGGGAAKAALAVAYPEGSICTATNGVQTFRAAGTTGRYIFSLPEIGTWTVTITAGEKMQSADVLFDEEFTAKSLRISYELDVDIGEGFSALGYDYKEQGRIAQFEITPLDYGVNIYTDGGNRADYYLSDETYDLTGYKTLNVDFIAFDYKTAYGGLGKDFKLAAFASREKKSGTVAADVSLVDSDVRVRTEGSATLDISGLTGNYYIGFESWSPNAYVVSVTITRMWLS